MPPKEQKEPATGPSGAAGGAAGSASGTAPGGAAQGATGGAATGGAATGGAASGGGAAKGGGGTHRGTGGATNKLLAGNVPPLNTPPPPNPRGRDDGLIQLSPTALQQSLAAAVANAATSVAAVPAASVPAVTPPVESGHPKLPKFWDEEPEAWFSVFRGSFEGRPVPELSMFNKMLPLLPTAAVSLCRPLVGISAADIFSAGRTEDFGPLPVAALGAGETALQLHFSRRPFSHLHAAIYALLAARAPRV